MTEFQPFLLERMMSKYEQLVEYNISESGVYPVFLKELLDGDSSRIEGLLGISLNYPHAEGIPELREHIAALYPGSGPENVLVTIGAAEANYITTHTLLQRGDGISIILPNYMQIWGIAKNIGLSVSEFSLQEDQSWALDRDELRKSVSNSTRLIAVCNPNNPTGHILTESEMDDIVTAADRVGAWILADEVYRGAERTTDVETPSFYGLYDKVVATGSLSKAYGIPGLRVGWVVAPVERIDDIWARHEYITISAGMLDNHLAALALSPEVRPRLIQRARDYIRKGYVVLEEWMESHGDTFSLTAPEAAAIAFVRYNLDINSTVLSERLCNEKSVYIVPGDHFGIDHHVRISFGLPHDYLVPALDRIHDLIMELSSQAE
ncbi:MAG: aminotransferase class I/II-fold pyridoxal phosphate-dependent enzyme [Fidelibacterota bacterium]|nr:MAG: aminotransferase class I/II-fold pyridoxal phosphate-dependent enzyme [Candidatus Neomarinimicrobiota bacterium]